MENGKQIRILLSISVVFCALIIGYNLFFTKEPAETIILTDGSPVADAQETAEASDTPAPVVEGKININTASASELQKLYRIGPVLAERIIAYREANGGFTTIEEIQNVSGIGEKTFAAIQEQIEVG